MRLRIPLICALVMALGVGMSYGQQPRQGRGGRGGGGIAGLLRRSDVQADLQLTDDQKSKIEALGQQMRQQFQNAGAGGTPPTPEERQARMAEMQKQYEAILTADQVKRVHEIQIQVAGVQAVRQKEVQEALGLTDEQKAKLKSLEETYAAANKSIQDKVTSGELDRQTSRTERQKNTQVLNDEIGKLLTADQQAKLKDLGGKPFTSTEQPRGGGGGGGR